MNNDPDLLFGTLLFLVLAVVGCTLLLATRKHRQTLPLQAWLFISALAVRFAMSVAIYAFGLVQVLGDEDASGWMNGAHLREGWLARGVGIWDLPYVLTGAFGGQHRGYGYLLGALFVVTDTPARLPAAALNCFFGALTVVFAYRIARTLFSEWVAVRVGWVACFFPSMIVWSAQTVKEPIVILLETAALYGCVQLKLSGFSMRYILLCALAIVLVIPFRFYAAYIAGAAVVLALALPQLGKRKFTPASSLGLLALIVPVLILSGVLVQHEAQFEKYADLRRIEQFRLDVTLGAGSGSASRYDLETPGGFTLGMLDGAAHLMLAPFPWELGAGSLRMMLTLPELVVWYWLFAVGVLPGLWYAVRHRFNDIQPLLFLILAFGLLYSLMFGNIGLTYRMRAQLLPWLLIFAMVGLEQWVLRRRRAHKAFPSMPIPVRVQR